MSRTRSSTSTACARTSRSAARARRQRRRPCPRGRRRRLRRRAGRDARAGRRVRLRQVDHGRGMVLRLIDPTVGRDRCSTAGHRQRSRRASCAPLRRDMQIVFQDPYASLDPRMTVARHHRRAAARPRARRRTGRRERVAELLELVGLGPSTPGRLPARVLRRAAPAHRHRPRARARPGAARARRAGHRRSTCRSRRRSSTCCADLQRELGADLPLHRARPVGGAAHLATAIAVMYLGKIVELGARPRQSSRRPRIRTRRRCCRRCRSRTRAARRTRSGSC